MVGEDGMERGSGSMGEWQGGMAWACHDGQVRREGVAEASGACGGAGGLWMIKCDQR